MRIWQICESYPPKYGGGAGVVARDLSQILSERDHEVRVLTTESRPAADYEVRTEYSHGVRIARVNLRYLVDFDPDGWQVGLRKWVHHERRIGRFLDEQLAAWRPDIVQYHTTRPFGEAGPLTIARHGVPLVAMLHEAWFICGRLMLLRSPTSRPCSGPGPVKCLECMYSNYDQSHLRAAAKLSWRVPRLGIYPAYRLWRRRAARRALSSALAVSQFMVRAHQPHLAGSAEYLPLGVNLDGLPAARRERSRKPFRFGFFGGFQPNKGIWHVLDAAATLHCEGLEFELEVWGPGGIEETGAIASRGLEGVVHAHGMYQPDGMWNAYCEVDCAVMATTVCEPFGRIPIEARAVGVPTIAPHIGGLGESIRDGVDGLLYRFSDTDDLTRQMRRVLTESGLFERLVAAQGPVLDTRTRGAALEAVYKSIIADGRPSRPESEAGK